MDKSTQALKGTPEPTAMNSDGLLDCAQAAHYLNLSESYIRKAVASNKIPYVRIGTRTLFRRSDLDEWISERIVRTNDDIHSRAQSLTASTMLHSRHSRKAVRI